MTNAELKKLLNDESLSDEYKTRLVLMDLAEDLKNIASTFGKLKNCCENLKHSLREI
ncbi:MAG: hypothetical protein IJP96_09405 [Synergistaceae bacterium]|nr:hypothetical protein [Synergistaceae bacterium]